MAPLPNVHGTIGKIEPLLDSSLLARFADLPQEGVALSALPVRSVPVGSYPASRDHGVACWPPTDPLSPWACPRASWPWQTARQIKLLSCRSVCGCCDGLKPGQPVACSCAAASLG